ncbi:cytochrome C biogenesis protein CycH [Rhizobium sp. Root274]|uniref:c-type cytochrome biogenesis protein CcmI n=1 Tax=unclassified Rhizobium TaxID=2613769 RepID=UPI000712E090|nr:MULTISPECIES: c-type cytochrome biogenesis protein CcmI [unclassified Rhizobium]KQW31122.1 cytochrome C biogenesis protein CycH [Rhizobium sp. Root1240]KRD32669.1 cytochrome C biogenesis protein CycH [Rhizobium sp. Root274]
MLFWIFSALLTVLAAVLLLSPLLRASARATRYDEGEAAVYRDQLRELERDKAGGLISPEEADYARAEIGRRLLAVAGRTSSEDGVDEAGSGATGAAGEKPPRRSGYGLSQAFILLCLPLIGLAGYLEIGSPGTPDAPLAARIENPGDDVNLLIAKVERHLADNPDDGNGWNVLAPVYFRVGRLDDAELAFRNAVRLLGPDPERLNGLGETLVTRNDGIVTEDAAKAFEAARKMEPNNPRADYYLALALEQGGRRAEALKAFQEIAAASPANAPWMDLINRHIATNSEGVPLANAPAVPLAPANPANPAAPGNPTAGDIAASQDMSAADRDQMIRGMVESLDQRLKDDPNNFEGWMRLVRSYAMLKDKARAEAALKDGLKAFPADGAEGQQLVAMARELGLDVEEVTP